MTHTKAVSKHPLLPPYLHARHPDPIVGTSIQCPPPIATMPHNAMQLSYNACLPAKNTPITIYHTMPACLPKTHPLPYNACLPAKNTPGGRAGRPPN